LGVLKRKEKVEKIRKTSPQDITTAKNKRKNTPSSAVK